MRTGTTWLALACATIALGCRGTTDPAVPCGDTGMRVSAGGRPTLEWSSACTAVEVEIADVEVGIPFNLPFPITIWKVQATTALLRPPLRFGEEPAGSTRVVPQAGPASDLVPGRLYVLRMSIQTLGSPVVRKDSLRFTAR